MDTVVQPAGNFYDKYNTRNPIARALMQGFLTSFAELVTLAGTPGNAYEVGCGEGELSMRLATAGWQISGCDIADDAVSEACTRASRAGLKISFERRDLHELDGLCERFDLVVCCEVLEHIDDPVAGIRILSALCDRYLLVSVPREPVWRGLNLLRGRYIRQLGNTPGHIQHWSRKSFLSLLNEHVEIVAVRSPLPWTMALCRPRHG